MTKTAKHITPQSETAAAMSVNQVVRSVGFTTGSALTGLLLAWYTPAGQFEPAGHGYGAAGLAAGSLAVVTIAIAATMPRAVGA